jgi:hypothetical protein
MRRILVLLLLLVLAVAGQPALAAGAKTGAPGTNVEMPFLIAPMSKDGKLLGYAYISSKMVASSQAAAIGVREKLAFIQDAFVRDVYAKPISKADDPRAVDTALLNARLVAAARRIVGSDKVVSMIFIAVQFAPLHPGETTPNPAPPSERAPGANGAAPAPTQDQNNGQTDASAAAPAPATSKPAQDATH